jgi:transcriptional regulator with XRE-family HTH domain
MENYRKILGRNVRAARKDLGWSQEDLAFETGKLNAGKLFGEHSPWKSYKN